MGEPVQYAPGQQLPGTVYRVVRHLATGGMGSVYDVEDVTVGKRYVLKTLHPLLVSRDDLAKRMEQEARWLAKLQHPNIVDVVTAGLTKDAQPMPFYVMERLNGQNLRVVIEKKGSLEREHCFRIAIDVLDALEHAHEHAVIHRDVKPENIFLHRNANGTTTTKLLDFGIMRILDRKASDTQGKFIGTLRYASPEQILGGELGPKTDIYSLGIVLYEMLAGRGPFDELGEAYAIGAAHAQRPPPLLSTFVAVPAPLERLVMSALGKTPDERPRDCFTFASELGRMLRAEQAAPKSTTAINVLSSAPPNTQVSLSIASTELSPVPSAPAQKTDVGMPVPSMIVAATLSSQPGFSSVRGSGPVIDREARTHASAGSGSTQRLAQNGTAIDDAGAVLLPDDAVRDAMSKPAPLVVPDVSGHGHDARISSELVFPPASVIPSGTGPLAGEASTRPPERGMLLPLIAAAAVGAALVGGAVLMVAKPWTKSAIVHDAPPAVSAIATAAAAPTTPPPGATTSAAVPSAPIAPILMPVAVPTIAPAAPAVPPASMRPNAGAPTARTRPDVGPAASSSAQRRPPRPPAAGPRPEEVGYE